MARLRILRSLIAFEAVLTILTWSSLEIKPWLVLPVMYASPIALLFLVSWWGLVSRQSYSAVLYIAAVVATIPFYLSFDKDLESVVSSKLFGFMRMCQGMTISLVVFGGIQGFDNQVIVKAFMWVKKHYLVPVSIVAVVVVLIGFNWRKLSYFHRLAGKIHIPAAQQLWDLEALEPVLLKEKAQLTGTYRGLSHHWSRPGSFFEDLFFTQCIPIGGYYFKIPEIKVSTNTIELIEETFSKTNNFSPYLGMFKLCGGFHPDYAFRFLEDGREKEILVCLGCDEVVFYFEGESYAVDISGGLADNLSSALDEDASIQIEQTAPDERLRRR